MDREEEGREYLAEHKIPDLLHTLTALLLFHRPDRPREFLIRTLEKIKLAKLTNSEYPCLMDDSNLDAMFGMLDVERRGCINIAQYKGALEALGLSSTDEPYEETDLISQIVFRDNVMKKICRNVGSFLISNVVMLNQFRFYLLKKY